MQPLLDLSLPAIRGSPIGDANLEVPPRLRPQTLQQHQQETGPIVLRDTDRKEWHSAGRPLNRPPDVATPLVHSFRSDPFPRPRARRPGHSSNRTVSFDVPILPSMPLPYGSPRTNAVPERCWSGLEDRSSV